ncbi:acyl-CoA synthetase [Variovorax dokdonensis]|uniref:Acyl-CoA synthetase n=1 Tax=Variovorax dokdonensis TaxID=344883 RepID=A0ABT7NCB4_9BURK|nr:acyl-CoA synthetase [Variovorax dokdonensis]MDM0045573.1 acyl-CoA synthetase [Variovorax dokdonensis]
MGESSAHWARTPERSNLLALRFFCALALACGRRVARLVLHPLTLYFFMFSPGPRRHVKRYLARAIGRGSNWRDGYRLIHAFAATVLDRLYFLRGRMDLFDLRVVGHEALDAELARGRGAFLLGAHVGSFEAVGASRQTSEQPEGLPLAMLMYLDNAQRIHAVLTAISDKRCRPEVIPLGQPDSMLQLRDWLDAGGLAGLLADRTLPPRAEDQGQRGSSRTVNFLGHPAEFNDGPFRLAALLRRKAFFMAGAYLGGNRYEVRFEALADFSAVAPGQREAAIQDALQAYVARLEALCREHPYNWFNFHDFWQEDAR